LNVGLDDRIQIPYQLISVYVGYPKDADPHGHGMIDCGR
jgi:hypothetical protein